MPRYVQLTSGKGINRLVSQALDRDGKPWKIEGDEIKELPEECPAGLINELRRGILTLMIDPFSTSGAISSQVVIPPNKKQQTPQKVILKAEQIVIKKKKEPTKEEKEKYWENRKKKIIHKKDEQFKVPELNKISDDPKVQRQVDKLFQKIGFKK